MLDQAKVELPLFIAADQKRIPPVTVPGSDLSVMSVSMIEMKTQLKQMATAQKQLVDVVASMQQKMQSLPEQVSARVSSAAESSSLSRHTEPDSDRTAPAANSTCQCFRLHESAECVTQRQHSEQFLGRPGRSSCRRRWHPDACPSPSKASAAQDHHGQEERVDRRQWTKRRPPSSHRVRRSTAQGHD